jgi:hypothetical protein
VYKEVFDDKGEVIFLIEITPVTEEDLDRTSVLRSARTAAHHTLDTLDQVSEAVAQTCGHLITHLRDRLADAAPDDLEISFGVSLAGEGGVPMVGKIKADSTFEVRAKWQRSPWRHQAVTETADGQSD